jgi:hypothetical protein
VLGLMIVVLVSFSCPLSPLLEYRRLRRVEVLGRGEVGVVVFPGNVTPPEPPDLAVDKDWNHHAILKLVLQSEGRVGGLFASGCEMGWGGVRGGWKASAASEL